MVDPVLEPEPPTGGPSVPLEAAGRHRWTIPRSHKPGMRVEGLLYASEAMLASIKMDKSAEQVANVATLPGIVGRSLAMPDIHWGYGFPIGGVAAMDAEAGVVSPGGIGFDINCGVRVLRTDLTEAEVRPKMKALVDELFRHVPSGVGGKGAAATSRVHDVLTEGARWAIDNGYGWTHDLERLEEGGRMKGALPDHVSPRARERGGPQLGSLGSGNHFLEVQAVDRIEDDRTARAFGFTRPGQVCIMLHTGSRGLGHQVCTDHLETFARHLSGWGFELPDRQLACAPMRSNQAEAYLGAMMAAANFAWANRQIITHQTRLAFTKVLGRSPEELGLDVVYDVSHNMAKLEEHPVEGRRRRLVVHRKGATRAFGPGRTDVPARYRDHGQPVLVPGSMGTASWVLAGTSQAMDESWGSCCHGAGRRLSRSASTRTYSYNDVTRSMRESGIYLHSLTRAGVTEEAPGAYKDVDAVVDVAHEAGLGRKVVRLRPLGVVKG
jgi:tRNA-splicing ligase RtcB (3'-phosphate/5'-hydroxy nucleic acid ligase)